MEDPLDGLNRLGGQPKLLPHRAPMKKRLAQHPRGWDYCPLCNQSINRASDGKGGTVVVERCPLGAGDLALTLPLFEGEPLLATQCQRSQGRYRRHRCIQERAHSAASFEGKRAPELENISYRTFGPSAGDRK
jgi:hypothetical protein